MSGDAGASMEGELYSIAIGTGVIVNVAPPPGDVAWFSVGPSAARGSR